jgi:MOSC domain-containing protein YiiM
MIQCHHHSSLDKKTEVMQLISVNIGRSEVIKYAKEHGVTGIYKRPVEGEVGIVADGIPGDAICDVENHGGVDQAVYVYGATDYAWWSEELGRPLDPGTFGENLTISGLQTAPLLIGDRLLVGTVLLEVTAPRIPCVTLAVRMSDPAFVKRFRQAERPGVYCRVLEEGFVQMGDPVEIERYEGPEVSALEIFRDFFAPTDDEATIRRHLAAPLAIRARHDKEQQLQKVLASRSR